MILELYTSQNFTCIVSNIRIKFPESQENFRESIDAPGQWNELVGTSVSEPAEFEKDPREVHI